jgi:hypothetical protein
VFEVRLYTYSFKFNKWQMFTIDDYEECAEFILEYGVYIALLVMDWLEKEERYEECEIIYLTILIMNLSNEWNLPSKLTETTFEELCEMINEDRNEEDYRMLAQEIIKNIE